MYWRQGKQRLSWNSIVATLLWAFGIFIIGLTVYSLIFWEGGLTIDLHDGLLIFVAFSSGINAIATGALIDMHTIRYIRAKIYLGKVKTCNHECS